MKRVDYVTLDGIKKSAVFRSKRSLEYLNRSQVFLEELMIKLKAKYLIRIVEA